jgi:hypothetical protein
MDGSTDVAGLAQLLEFVRYCSENIQGEVIFCLPLSESCAGSEIFKAVNDYMAAGDIFGENCVGICRDGAAASTGHKKGFQAEVQPVGQHVNFTHCIVRREASASRDIEPKQKSVLQEAVKAVNFGRVRSSHCRLFGVLCKQMRKSLFVHSEVRLF